MPPRATAYYPGDLPPALDVGLASPVDGCCLHRGRIVVSGRADDDISIARVEVGIVNSPRPVHELARARSPAPPPSWRTAFLNSPGSPGSNFSYTTPVIPDGTYTVLVRGRPTSTARSAPEP